VETSAACGAPGIAFEDLEAERFRRPCHTISMASP
jgi:hypothetical protein